MGSVAGVRPRLRVKVELSGDPQMPHVQQACWRIRAAVVDELRAHGLVDRYRHETMIRWSQPVVLELWAHGDVRATEDAIRRAVQDGAVRALAVHVETINDDGGAG